MNWKIENRLIVADQRTSSSDTLNIYDADRGRLVFTSSEPQLEGLSKVFRVIGGQYGKMAGIDYSICDAASGRPVLRVFRTGRMIGPTPPFELFDGLGTLLARFSKCFSVRGDRWRLKNGGKEKLFDVSVKQRSGFALSVKSLAYDILVDDVPFASVTPYKNDSGTKYEGKRLRLVEFDPSTEKDQDRRLLLLGICASLDRIVQHRHN